MFIESGKRYDAMAFGSNGQQRRNLCRLQGGPESS
jgi:hypothetical protein